LRLVTLDFEGAKRRFVLFEYEGQGRLLRLVKDDRSRLLEGMASSEFFFDVESCALAKVKRDKYRGHKRPLRWLFRDYLDKRLFFQFEARKEIRSKRIVQAAGLVTPDCVAWGVSLNPRNPLGSVLLMDHVDDAVTGAEFFRRLEEAERYVFLERICDDLMRLARAGYVHRDLQ
jgi:tRNA A-37 threonylcarbamoyl transferase component Bud32